MTPKVADEISQYTPPMPGAMIVATPLASKLKRNSR
jgi:hypothetical protein